MPRHYVCGIVRDQLKRFLVTQYHLTNGRRISSVSVESWLGERESPIKALTAEFKQCFGIPSIDVFNIRNTKVLTRVSDVGTQFINVFLMDIREPTTFKLLDDVAEINFMQWDHLLNAVNTKAIIPTVYSKCITDRIHTWKSID